ncbi:MAG TPA: lipocalin-like domain-containing protein [Xanthobacteraceae bacterium]|nr:lipocalin-like domain-containing protein [Xanthobacteraceae bacterium]
MRGILIGFGLLFGLSSMMLPARAEDAADRARIVGTWKLVSVNYEDQETKAVTPIYGEHPKGYQIATPEGRWLALVTAEGRKVPQTDAERAQALRTMISYAGRYRVADGKVTTKVEVAWNEAWVGGEQTRFIRFDGDLLHIESPPMPHPNLAGKVVRVIVTWQRDK